MQLSHPLILFFFSTLHSIEATALPSWQNLEARGLYTYGANAELNDEPKAASSHFDTPALALAKIHYGDLPDGLPKSPFETAPSPYAMASTPFATMANHPFGMEPDSPGSALSGSASLSGDGTPLHPLLPAEVPNLRPIRTRATENSERAELHIFHPNHPFARGEPQPRPDLNRNQPDALNSLRSAVLRQQTRGRRTTSSPLGLSVSQGITKQFDDKYDDDPRPLHHRIGLPPPRNTVQCDPHPPIEWEDSLHPNTHQCRDIVTCYRGNAVLTVSDSAARELCLSKCRCVV